MILLSSTAIAVLPISLLLDTKVESCLGEGQGYSKMKLTWISQTTGIALTWLSQNSLLVSLFGRVHGDCVAVAQCRLVYVSTVPLDSTWMRSESSCNEILGMVKAIDVVRCARGRRLYM